MPFPVAARLLFFTEIEGWFFFFFFFFCFFFWGFWKFWSGNWIRAGKKVQKTVVFFVFWFCFESYRKLEMWNWNRAGKKVTKLSVFIDVLPFFGTITLSIAAKLIFSVLKKLILIIFFSFLIAFIEMGIFEGPYSTIFINTTHEK